MRIPSWLNKILVARSFGIDKPDDIRLEIIGISAFLFWFIESTFGTISDFFPSLATLRPSSIVVLTFGILFGPVAALGGAIGTLIASLFGDINLGVIFVIIGNFLLAYVGFIFWQILTKGEFTKFNFKYLAIFWLSCFIASLVSALIIVGGYSWLNLPASFKIIFLNNFVWSAIFGPYIFNLVKRGALRNLFN